MDETPLLWQARAFIYRHFAETARPPTVDETAAHFKISSAEAAGLYQELHGRHAVFLGPQTLAVRMANPFSAVPTEFKVHSGGRSYFANCAWDMLGIPAALGQDAQVEAVCADSGETVRLEVKNGRVRAGDLLVHFPLPFARWYDDLLFT